MKKLIMDCNYFKEPIYMPKELYSIDRLGKIDDVEPCAEHCKRKGENCDNCVVQKCFKRLAEYEGIGLTPDQIREVDRLYAEKCKEVAEKCKEVVELKKSTFTGMKLANIAIAMKKLREYQELEAKGLIIRIDKEAAGVKGENQ